LRSLLLLVVFAAPAFAQPEPPPPPPTKPGPVAEAIEAAKIHFQQGVALFNDGNFNGALAEFQAAYDLRPSPGLLYNIGLTQKALFRYADAVATCERYLAEETKLTPERRAEVTQLIREMNALLADVTLTVEPTGASIHIDGRDAGRAPLDKPLRLAAGSHVVDIASDGYKPVRKDLMISAGNPVTLNIRLDLIPKTGLVQISAKPPESIVRVDGKVMGYPPVSVELGAGGHQLEVQAPKFVLHSQELIVAAGQRRDIFVELHRPPSKFYEKWYFWTPLTVAVAGGLALGLGLGLRTQDPLKGTLSPGLSPVN
jgi:hypothetical protein